MPLWWRTDRPEELTVRALHDGRSWRFLLVWADATDDHTAIRPQDFRDAAAVEFALTADPPFFAMGAKAQFVNIWMWKSERQADLEPAFQDLEKVYPNLGIDSYPNLLIVPDGAADAPRADAPLRPDVRDRLGRRQHRGRPAARERRRGPGRAGLRDAARRGRGSTSA